MDPGHHGCPYKAALETKIKKWISEFKQSAGRLPTSNDIRNTSEILSAYQSLKAKPAASQSLASTWGISSTAQTASSPEPLKSMTFWNKKTHAIMTKQEKMHAKVQSLAGIEAAKTPVHILTTSVPDTSYVLPEQKMDFLSSFYETSDTEICDESAFSHLSSMDQAVSNSLAHAVLLRSSAQQQQGLETDPYCRKNSLSGHPSAPCLNKESKKLNRNSPNYIKFNLKHKNFSLATKHKSKRRPYQQHSSDHEEQHPSFKDQDSPLLRIINPSSVQSSNRVWGASSLYSLEDHLSDKEIHTDLPTLEDLKLPELSPESTLSVPIESVNTAGTRNEINLEYYLNELYGCQTFRPAQREAVQRLLDGNSTLVLMPTGSGKSLIFQLFIYILKKLNQGIECIGIVVFPLLSLMKDQLLNLPKLLRAACLNSEQAEHEKRQTARDISLGHYDLVFVSPELLTSAKFWNLVHHPKHPFPRIAFGCIDEAHCVSEWSHNFRPALLKVGHILKEKLNVRTILALSATMTREALSSVLTLLQIPASGVIRGIGVPINIEMCMSDSEDKKSSASSKDELLLQVLQERLPSTPSVFPVLVYCTTQYQTEQVAFFLRRNGYEASYYHAGMELIDRKKTQERFQADKIKILACTVAFGMGVNKSNIRGVIHYNVPKSIENYVQEIGRAGRDGLFCFSHLLYSQADVHWHQSRAYSHALQKNQISRLLAYLFSDLLSSPSSLSVNPSGKKQRYRLLPEQPTCDTLNMEEQSIVTILCKLEQPPLSMLAIDAVIEHKCTMQTSLAALQAAHCSAKQDSKTNWLVPLLLSHFALEAYPSEHQLDLCEFALQYSLCARDLYYSLRALSTKKGVRMRFSSKAWCYTVLPSLGNHHHEMSSHLSNISERLFQIAGAVCTKTWSKATQMGHLARMAIHHPASSPKSVQQALLRKHIHNYFTLDFKATSAVASTMEGESDALVNEYALASPRLLSPKSMLKRQDQGLVKIILRQKLEPVVLAHIHQIPSSLDLCKLLHGISTPKYPLGMWKQYSFVSGYIQYNFELLLCVLDELYQATCLEN